MSHLYLLPSEGRITLQIPEYDILPVSALIEDLKPELAKYPSDWFVVLHAEDGIPCVGKEQGFLFWSEWGWAANRTAIRKEFLNSNDPRGTWDDFEVHAEAVFILRKKKLQKRIKTVEKHLQELKNHV